MSHHNSPQSQPKADDHKDNQHGYRHDNLRYNNGNKEHHVDKLLPPEFKFLQSDAAQNADDDTDDCDHHGNNQGVGQRFPQVMISKGKELGIPLGSESRPGIIPLGIIEREQNHYQDGNIENGVNQRRKDGPGNLPHPFPLLFTVQFFFGSHLYHLHIFYSGESGVNEDHQCRNYKKQY